KGKNINASEMSRFFASITLSKITILSHSNNASFSSENIKRTTGIKTVSRASPTFCIAPGSVSEARNPQTNGQNWCTANLLFKKS
ncbi:MAG TPA: hypothetical protein PLC05_02375, partial [bacterium]|nr:hypothetical protein [bacterium]